MLGEERKNMKSTEHQLRRLLCALLEDMPYMDDGEASADCFDYISASIDALDVRIRNRLQHMRLPSCADTLSNIATILVHLHVLATREGTPETAKFLMDHSAAILNLRTFNTYAAGAPSTRFASDGVTKVMYVNGNWVVDAKAFETLYQNFKDK